MNNKTNELPINLLSLHHLLRSRRQALGLTQWQIAQELGVGPETISLWEKGSRRMELNRVPRLAAVLRLNPKDLCQTALAEWHPAFFAGLFPAPSSRPLPAHTPLEPAVIIGDSLRQSEQLPQ
jgi:transcriptional regulator with XRE-family HTH domain